MARISYATRDQVPEGLRELFDNTEAYGPFGSLIGAMAQRPPILEHVFGLLLDLRREGVLKRRYLELALVAVSKLNECTYCVSHHSPMLNIEGVSQEGIARILDYQDHPELDDIDKLVVEYAKLVTLQANQVRDGIFDRLRRHFDDSEIVELTWRIALCGAFNRFNDVLQLDIEPEVEVQVA